MFRHSTRSQCTHSQHCHLIGFEVATFIHLGKIATFRLKRDVQSYHLQVYAKRPSLSLRKNAGISSQTVVHLYNTVIWSALKLHHSHTFSHRYPHTLQYSTLTRYSHTRKLALTRLRLSTLNCNLDSPPQRLHIQQSVLASSVTAE